MSCCGNQRAALRHEVYSSPGNETQYWTSGPIDFEYSGNGELSVIGPISGTVYRFTATDRRVRIHGSDAPSLLSVPGLTPLR